MADIVINGDRYAKGKLSISRYADFNSNPIKVIVSGMLSVHRYFEEITELETRRYKLIGVQVIREDFGSDDHSISYSFIADKLIVKGIDEKGESLFSYEDVEKLEDILYPDEDINNQFIKQIKNDKEITEDNIKEEGDGNGRQE